MNSILQEGLLNAGGISGRQILHERAAIERGRAARQRKADETIKKGRGATLSPLQAFTRYWHEELAADLRRFRRESPEAQDQQLAVMVLRALDPDLVAQTVLTNAVSGVARYPGGVPVQKIGKKIGADLEAALKGKVIGKELREVAKNHPCRCRKCWPYGEIRRGACEKLKRMRGVRRLLGSRETSKILRIARHKADMLPEELAWIESKVFTTVGIALLERIPTTVAIEGRNRQGQKVQLRAFDIAAKTIVTEEHSGKRIRKPRSLIPRATLNKQIRYAVDRWSYQRPHYPPLLIPPIKWSDPEAGVYYSIRKGLIANGTRDQYELLKGRDLTKVFDGLDAVGSIDWQLTPQLVRVNLAIANNEIPELRKGRFNKAGRWVSAIDNIPPIDDPPPIVHPLIKKGRFKTAAEIRRFYKTKEGQAWQKSAAGRAWGYKAVKFYDMLDELESLRQVYSLQLDEMIRHADEKKIYFGHHIDFRGRAQPMMLYFSHHGPDWVRGSLRFGTAETPTEDSGFWIRVAAANHWGHGWGSKPFDERVQFAELMAPMIARVAKDPLTNREWLNADEPFQFLSACIALHDPKHAKKFVVWQDASANGLQHLSAAGRDPATAVLCNLVAGERKLSPYKIVVHEGLKILDDCVVAETEYVLEKVRAELNNKGDEIVKQPVLSTPYNVTDQGRRDQAFGQLEARGWKDDEAFDGARLLSAMVAQVMYKVAPGAMAILDWLKICTEKIVTPNKRHKKGRPLRLPSPSGLPVLQAYFNERAESQRVNGHQYSLVRSDSTLKVNVDRQIDACAANTVHMWDAANAADTSVRCRALGMQVPTIFDSFGSHPGHTRRVRSEFLDSLVELHKVDRLAELAEFWRNEYPDVAIPDPPPRGTFDINHARTATYALN